jgi:hypothetical protein
VRTPATQRGDYGGMQELEQLPTCLTLAENSVHAKFAQCTFYEVW